MPISMVLREGWRQGWHSVPRSTGPGLGTKRHGGGGAVCAVWGALGLPGPGGLGTELSLSERRKQLGSGRMEHMAGEFGRMPGNETGGGLGVAVKG